MDRRISIYFISNLWTEDLSIFYFPPYLPGLKHSFHTQGYIRIGLMRVQGGDSEKCLLFNHHYFLTYNATIYIFCFRACILAIFWLISLEEHFVEFRVLTVDTYDCPPCTWAEAFLSNPWT